MKKKKRAFHSIKKNFGKRLNWNLAYSTMVLLVGGAFLLNHFMTRELSESFNNTVVENKKSVNLQNRLDDLHYVIQLIYFPVEEAAGTRQRDSSRAQEEANAALPLFEELIEEIVMEFSSLKQNKGYEDFGDTVKSIHFLVLQMLQTENRIFNDLKNGKLSNVSSLSKEVNEHYVRMRSRIRYLKQELQSLQDEHHTLHLQKIAEIKTYKIWLSLLALAILIIVVVLGQFFSKKILQMLNDHRESEERFRAVTDSTYDSIITFNSERKIILWNQQALKTFQFSDEKDAIKNIQDIVHSESWSAFRTSIDTLSLGNSIKPRWESQMVSFDGALFPCLVDLSTWSARGESFYTAVIRDISEEKRAEQELKNQRAKIIHSDRLVAIGQLAAGVAHEINNPLAVVKSNSELIHELSEYGELNKDSLYELIENQNKAIDRIANIVNGLTAYARTESEVEQLFDCHQSIDETIRLVEGIFNKSGVQIQTELNSKSFHCKGNLSHFQQLVMNILANARDALDGVESARIKVSTHSKDDLLVITIADNGKGIEKEQLSRIFEAFYTTKPIGQGTGMGLALCSSFAQELGGFIEVKSELNEGTEFTISIPTCEEKSPSLNIESKKYRPHSFNGRVLLADDEEDLRKSLKTMLTMIGLQVVDVSNGLEAIDRLKQESFDYLITDLQMPKMRGEELIEQAHKIIGFNSSVIVVTGGAGLESDSKKHQEIMRSLVDGTISKPFSLKDVSETLHNCQPNVEKVS